jgi:hypothetical protein
MVTMKRMKSLLRGVLTLVLLGSNVPAWSGVYACGSGGHGLACIKACAAATALFTQDGKLPDIGTGSCHVKVQAAPDSLLSGPASALSAPSHVVLALVAGPRCPARVLAGLGLDSRGPPPGRAYLSFQHPFANGPPTLL